jgi:hypothetical protein
MPKKTRDYSFLFEKFSREHIQNRLVFLLNQADDFVTHFSKRIENRLNIKIEHKDYFFVNPDIMGEIVLDYFTDIYRIRSFHPIERVNAIKVSAFSTYWVVRKRPIQIVKSIESDKIIHSSWTTYINESFGVALLLSLAFDFSTSRGIDTRDTFLDFTDLALYNFIYREFSSKSLELTLQGLCVALDIPLLTDEDCI